jgi:lipopolysaccharide export system permease protein
LIITRYLVREVVSPFVGVSVLLVVIFMTYSLSVFLSDAGQGLLGPQQVVYLTAFKTLIALEVLLPIALYVGVVLGIGRLYQDAEMDALRAGGVGQLQILAPLLRVAILLALLVGMLSIVIRPMVYVAMYRMRAEAEVNSEIDRVKGGRFYSYDRSGRTVFVEGMKDSTERLSGVFIRSSDGGGLEVISGGTGRFVQFVTPTHHELAVDDAHVFKRTAGGRNLFGQFGKFSIRLPARQPEELRNRPKIISTFELDRAGDARERAEFQWRVSTPISTLLLTLLAVPLSHTRPRKGRFARMLLSMAAYALYFNLLNVARTWVEQGTISSIFWVPSLLGAVAVALYLPWRWWLLKRREARHVDA